MVPNAARDSCLYLCDFEWREDYCDLHSLCRCTTITVVQLQHNEVWVTYKSLSIINSVIWNNRRSVSSHSVESNQFSWPYSLSHWTMLFSDARNTAFINHIVEQVRNILHNAKQMGWINIRNCLGQCFSQCTVWWYNWVSYNKTRKSRFKNLWLSVYIYTDLCLSLYSH